MLQKNDSGTICGVMLVFRLQNEVVTSLFIKRILKMLCAEVCWNIATVTLLFDILLGSLQPTAGWLFGQTAAEQGWS